MTSVFPLSRRSTVLAFAADALLVIIFVTIGRRSHSEGITAGGMAQTAWPFLMALVVGWLITRAWRAPLALRHPGLAIWGSTVVVGVALRLISGQGAPVGFVVVTALVLGVFLLGWRAIFAFVRSRRSEARRRVGS